MARTHEIVCEGVPIRAEEIARTSSVAIFRTETGRVLAYEIVGPQCSYLDDPATDLRRFLDDGPMYVRTLLGLGLEADDVSDYRVEAAALQNRIRDHRRKRWGILGKGHDFAAAYKKRLHGAEAEEANAAKGAYEMTEVADQQWRDTAWDLMHEEARLTVPEGDDGMLDPQDVEAAQALAEDVKRLQGEIDTSRPARLGEAQKMAEAEVREFEGRLAREQEPDSPSSNQPK
jgi:hypothetical protein